MTKFPESEISENHNKQHLCGVPLWLQAPEIPVCPRSGKVMQFVVAIQSDSEHIIVEPTGTKNLPFGNYLIFGDEGILYVFYQPESKVLFAVSQF